MSNELKNSVQIRSVLLTEYKTNAREKLEGMKKFKNQNYLDQWLPF